MFIGCFDQNDERLSNHPDFVGIIPICFKILNPNHCAIRIGKIQISTGVKYFHQILIENELGCPEKLKKLQEISNKIEYIYAERVKFLKISDRNCCVRTPEMAFQSLYWEACPQIPPAKGAFGA